MIPQKRARRLIRSSFWTGGKPIRPGRVAAQRFMANEVEH